MDYDDRIKRLLHRVKGELPENPITKARNRTQRIRDHIQGTDSYQEPSKSIPIADKCEVLVVGGGPAGLSAAIGARRTGVDVILLERFGCFGGVITTVGMETLGWYRYEGTQDSEGIGREMERIAQRMGGCTKWPYNDSQCLDAERFKVVADNLVTEHGIRPLLHTWAVEAIVQEGQIKGVITESKSGRQVIMAKRVVDATGDADICYLAGCPYTSLELKDRMGVTQVFNCAGVDTQEFLRYNAQSPKTYQAWGNTWKQGTTGKEDHLLTPYLGEEFQRAREAGVIPDKDTQLLGGSWSALSEAGEATNLNLVHLNGYDCTQAKDLTEAEMKGRKQVDYALKALQHSVPGFQNSKLRNFGMTMGTRDSRKILGKYNLTAEDVLQEGRFLDSIGIFPEFLDGYNILVLPTTGRYFQVPLGCLIPQGVDNLLVAGRCVAGDSVSHTAMRNMMACTVTGQGAGVAAAVSVLEDTAVQKTSINKIQEQLLSQGVRIN